MKDIEKATKPLPQPHANHRKRVIDRAMREGFENFKDHELLELLLYFSKPRVDTNPTAHALLDRYESIKGIVERTADELCFVDGIGDRSALLLKLIPELMKRYERDCFAEPPSYRSLEKVAQLLHPYFVGLNYERLYAVFFNNRMNLIDCRCMSDGSVNSTDVMLSKITSTALRYNAAAVILAHNHPNGSPAPSQEDLDLNLETRRQLSTFGIVLVEHLVFSEYSYRAMMRDEGYYRLSPLSHKQDVGFYQKFYQSCSFEIEPLFEKTE